MDTKLWRKLGKVDMVVVGSAARHWGFGRAWGSEMIGYRWWTGQPGSDVRCPEVELRGGVLMWGCEVGR